MTIDEAHERAIRDATDHPLPTWEMVFRTYLASMEKSGWVMMPLKSFPEMDVAAEGVDVHRWDATLAYKRMLAARPKLKE